jgi:hypothetical protein
MIRPPKPDWLASSGRIRNWGDSGHAGRLVGKAALDPLQTCVLCYSKQLNLAAFQRIIEAKFSEDDWLIYNTIGQSYPKITVSREPVRLILR